MPAQPPQTSPSLEPRGEVVSLLGEEYYQIRNFDAIEPFFISLLSSSDHWLFIASTGGLSAGRGSAEQALFPYYTVDHLTENSENTGGKAIFRVHTADQTHLWEPLSDRWKGAYAVQRSLYKNLSGTALVFEEINLDLRLTYRSAWRTSEKFGFVKTTWLINDGDAPCQVEVLDGLQNLLPANVSSATQNIFSSLLDAYKRSELEPHSGLGIFSLNSALSDLAEPSESLLATTVFQLGLDAPQILLSSLQLDRFRAGEPIETESEVRGRRGAYFVHAALELSPHSQRFWHLAADVQQDHAAIAARLAWLRGEPASPGAPSEVGALVEQVEQDIAAGQAALWAIIAQADGVQHTAQPLVTAHHFANVLFNVMRGGIFIDGYWIQAADFARFVRLRNPRLWQEQAAFFAALPEKLLLPDLLQRAQDSASPDLLRLAGSYLPLAFSRRHGDPSRPWNRFSINVKNPDGSLKVDYEGNWRDIFQNWEALAYSYPEFIESMISVFLNATTVDGYNPYRITYHGLDWELPEPGNPWANIGYWNDHQIIYLQKLMEFSARAHPGRLAELLARPLFSYSHVPYQIKPYAELVQDPYNTIVFDWDLQRKITARQAELGADARLVLDADGQVVHVSLAEKLLTLLLAKLANFVPEGGIWMNTQRPEWNDANNALAGKGLSVVTLAYLRRYLAFCQELFAQPGQANLPVSAGLARFYRQVENVLDNYQPVLAGPFSDEQRRAMMDALGQAAGDYRAQFYQFGLSGEQEGLPAAGVLSFLQLAQEFVDHSLRANRRSDDLFHAYNILHLAPGRAWITRLDEMLEGQVAILSSGLLSAGESVALLKSLRHGPLYQAAQHSYILYPEKAIPGFLQKNVLSQAQVDQAPLLGQLAAAGDASILTRDVDGAYHFNARFRNAKDLNQALDALKDDPRFAAGIDAGREQIAALYEETFHHDQFTGRSGSFFAYEGLGSIYWHMVAKLLLAVQENLLRFRGEAEAADLEATADQQTAADLQTINDLQAAYADIRLGLGFNKTPAEYGAFPTDPYSHTPKGQGAKQPGMTGMVKEEILTRQVELGLTIDHGRLSFDPLLLDRQELLDAPATFAYLDVNMRPQQLDLPAGALGYLVCQTPVVLSLGDESRIIVHFADGTQETLPGRVLDEGNSRHVFERDGVVRFLDLQLLLRS